MLLRKIEKNKIIGTVCAALPVALLLACGAVRENSDKVMLLEKQEASDESAILTVESRTGEEDEAQAVFVHICGEVVKPGVYELPEGSRIFDAVEAAGGFTQDASESYVNLAQVLEDGWKVEIPGAGAVCNAGPGNMAGITGNTADMGGNAGAGDGLVDINTATKQELCTLPGVGESRAESIISYRERNGGFERIEDIMKVEGIKEGMFSKMKDKICVRGGK